MKLVARWSALAANLAARASSQRVVLIGPLGLHDGVYTRAAVFPCRDKDVVAIGVAFSRDVPPPTTDLADFVRAARRAFRDVRVFASHVELAKEAQRLWPSAAADDLVRQSLVN